MKKLLLPALFALFLFQGKSQKIQIGDTANLYEVKNPGQWLTVMEKFGAINYTKFMNITSIDIYLKKSINRETGLVLKSIYFGGTTPYRIVDGEIYQAEIDKFVNALTFITDSLLPLKPHDEIFYYANLDLSDMRIQAGFDPYVKSIFLDKDTWTVVLNLNRYSLFSNVIIKNSDCHVLIDAIKKAKQKLVDF